MEGITGTRFYQLGVRVDGSALVQPAAMMRGLGETLPPNVAHEDTPVNEIRTGGGFTLVCPEGSVRAPKLIVAANLFAEWVSKKHRVVPFASLAHSPGN